MSIGNNKVAPDAVKSPEEIANQGDEMREAETSAKTESSKTVGWKNYRPKAFSAWAMIMATVLGGTYDAWYQGLRIGFGGYLIAQVLMGVAYIILVFSLAEIVSSVSFSGGAYGMARVMLGFYMGFLIAAFELTVYISYTATSFQFASEFLCDKMGWGDAYQGLVALVCYLISALFVLEGNHMFWTFSNLLGLFCVIGLFIYFFGSLQYTDITNKASLQVDPDNPSNLANWFRGGMSEYMLILPYTTWGFGGIEAGALVTDLIYKPRKNLSRGLVAAVLSLFVLMMFTMFVCVSLPPGLHSSLVDDDGTIVNMEFLMPPSFKLIGFNPEASQWIMWIAQMSLAFSFITPTAYLFHAMSCSKLIPEELGGKEIHVASCYTMLLSFGLCLCCLYIPGFNMDNLPIFCSMFTYFSDLYAYCEMQTVFTSMEREFRSPFGIVGAVYAGIVFLLCAVSIAGFQEGHLVLIVASCLFVLLSVYYFIYAKDRQTFSDEEQKTMLALHVMNLNRHKRLHKRKSKMYGAFFPSSRGQQRKNEFSRKHSINSAVSK
eukprot:gene4302-4609_t